MRDPLGLVGTTLERRYRVERVVGEGGFAVVYYAEALALGVPVALKVLRGELVHGATSMRARFAQEAKLLARLKHPAIVELLDASTLSPPSDRPGAPGSASMEAGTPYLVLAWIEGETLDARVMRTGPHSPADTARILAPAADAIAYAHGEGVIHRDIKPGNLMIGRVVDASRAAESERVRVLDFGVARWASETGVRTTTVSATGLSIGFAAPEQYGKEFGPVDGRADQFAFAAVIWSMLTAKPPFAGETLTEVMFATCMSPKRPSLASARPELIGRIDDVLTRALAIRPDDRFADLPTFFQAFRDAVAGRPALVGPAISADATPSPDTDRDAPPTAPRTLPTEREVAVPAMSTHPLAPETLPTTAPRNAHGANKKPRVEPLAPTERAPSNHALAGAIPARAHAPAPSAPMGAPPSTPESVPASSEAMSRRGPGRIIIPLLVGVGLVAASAFFARTWLEQPTSPPKPSVSKSGGSPPIPSKSLSIGPDPKAGPCGILADGEICMAAARIVRGPPDCGAEGDDAHRAACPAEEIFVASFVIDAYEVDIGRWSACAAAKRCPASPESLVDAGGSSADRPVRAVSAKDAEALCSFEKKRLPTDVEWERAAAGTARRSFPWGNERPSESRAVFGRAGGAASDADANALALLGPAKIGSLRAGATAEGVFDLAGNVAEWTSTRAPASAPILSTPGVEGDGRGAGHRRWVRGGSFRDEWDALRTWARLAVPENVVSDAIGFRCARTPR